MTDHVAGQMHMLAFVQDLHWRIMRAAQTDIDAIVEQAKTDVEKAIRTAFSSVSLEVAESLDIRRHGKDILLTLKIEGKSSDG